MRHRRHYTLEEARALRAYVADRVQLARDGLATLAEPESRTALDEVDPRLGGAWPGRRVARAVLDVQRAVGELHASDIVVRDIVRGLIDFPSIQDGEEVYLCWLVHEPEIGWWHELDAGFPGRRPL